MTPPASDTPATPRSPRLVQDTWGVVLCGGASRRMGRDKARLVVEGRTLLERVVASLETLAGRVLLASGTPGRYPELGREELADLLPDVGPLAGLGAALERIEREPGPRIEYLLTLACDLPTAAPEALAALLARAREQRAQACLLRTPGGLEPLFAVYHRSALAAVRAALARGEHRLDSFHRDVRLVTLDLDELAPELVHCARNLNTPEDLRALREVPA